VKQIRCTVCMDDASKLSGYSEHVIISISAQLADSLLVIHRGSDDHTIINFKRVLWFRSEFIEDEQASA
jgi:hypothetical protein